jgi:hypothetical protein
MGAKPSSSSNSVSARLGYSRLHTFSENFEQAGSILGVGAALRYTTIGMASIFPHHISYHHSR